jgi:hypothetical protein
MKTVFLLLEALAVLMMISVPKSSFAVMQCEVMTINASNEGKGIDPKLSQYSTIFKSPPFSKFNSFALVNSQVLQIELKTPKLLQLPDRIDGSLQMNSFSDDKFDITLTLARSSKSPIRINGIAAPNSPILAAGMKSPTGIWVFGVVCSQPADGISY